MGGRSVKAINQRCRVTLGRETLRFSLVERTERRGPVENVLNSDFINAIVTLVTGSSGSPVESLATGAAAGFLDCANLRANLHRMEKAQCVLYNYLLRAPSREAWNIPIETEQWVIAAASFLVAIEGGKIRQIVDACIPKRSPVPSAISIYRCSTAARPLLRARLGFATMDVAFTSGDSLSPRLRQRLSRHTIPSNHASPAPVIISSLL